MCIYLFCGLSTAHLNVMRTRVVLGCNTDMLYDFDFVFVQRNEARFTHKRAIEILMLTLKEAAAAAEAQQQQKQLQQQ